MRRTVVVLVVVAALGIFAAPAQASHGWQSHWAHKSSYYTIPVGDNVSDSLLDGKYDRAFKAAVKWWNNHPNIDLNIVAGKGCKAVTGTLQVCNPKVYDTWWAGKATSGADSYGHKKWAKTQYNRKYLDNYSEKSIQHTFCHEIGHNLGLGHIDTDSCMDAGDYGDTYPNQHDFDTLTSRGHIGTNDTQAVVFMANDSSPTVGPPRP